MNPANAQSLSGQRALIHGAAGAIGRPVAEVFAREGAHLYLAGRTGARVEAVAAALRAGGARAEAAQVDVLDAAAVDTYTDGVAARAGGLDDDFARPIAAYTRRLFVTAQAAARHLGRGAHGGAIISFSVPGSRLVGGTWFGNGTTFAAVEAMSRLLAGELGRRNIRAVCLRPDAIPDAVARGSHTAGVFGEVARAHGSTVEAMLAERAQVPAGMLRDEPAADAGADPRATREAAGTLIARLSPQERVALVLKEAFDLPLDDIAAVLGTTTGAIKAALHRGRDKLAAAPEPEPARVPVPAALDAFVAAFNAGDLAAVTTTLLDSATVEMPGLLIDVGVAATTDPAAGILFHSVTSPLSTGVAAAYLDGYLPARPRAELRRHRGEHVALLWYAHRDGDAVRGFLRFELTPDGDRIAALRAHFFAPEALAELAGELGVPSRSNGYGVEAVEV